MTLHQTFSDHAALLRDFIRRHALDDAAVATEPEFNQLALSLFALQFDQVPDYRQFCEARGDTPQTVEHWSQIPAIPATAFKELELTSLPPAQRQFTFHSSGTTEHRPAHHFHDPESLALYEASLLPWFHRHLFSNASDLVVTVEFSPSPPSAGERAGERGARMGDRSTHEARSRFLSLTPPPNLAPHSSLVHMFATVRREFGSPKSAFTGRLQSDGSWEVDCEQASAILRRAIADHDPVIVTGTAFNFVQLLDHLEAADLRLNLPAGSCALETGGYKGRSRALPKAELHSLITARLGIPANRIVSEYGMCELSSQAYDLNLEASNLKLPPRSFHFPPWARARIISPETGLEVADGETGLIRIFDLANVRSVLAIQTADLATRRSDGFELLGRAALSEARGCSLMSQ